MQQPQQIVAQQQQSAHSNQLQMQAAQQNGQLIGNSQLSAHQHHQYQLNSAQQHAHSQVQQSPPKKERKSQSIVNQQMLQQSNQIPTSISSNQSTQAVSSQQAQNVMLQIPSNNNQPQSQSSHQQYHQQTSQNPFQGRGYSSFNSSVVAQGGTILVPNNGAQMNNQMGSSNTTSSAQSHSNYYMQSSAATTAATIMLNANSTQQQQMQQQNQQNNQTNQGTNQSSQYSGQKGSAVTQGQVLLQQPTSQLNNHNTYKQVVIGNMNKTSQIAPMAIGQLNQNLPSEFSQIMQNIVVPQNHAIAVNSNQSHVMPMSMSPMPMPPTNAVIIGNGPGHHQQTTGAILNHHRRKQFRNLPAGHKLDQLQHHSQPQHHQQIVNHGGSFPSSNGIKQNGLRNSFMLNQPAASNGAQNINQPQQAQNEYFSINMNQQQTPQSQSTTMNSTAPNSANQGKIGSQTVYPIKSGKMRSNNEMTSNSTGVTQSNFNTPLNQQQIMAAQQQYLNSGQKAGNVNQLGVGAPDSSIYKIKSSQNIRLDDDISRERVALVHGQVQQMQNNQVQEQNSSAVQMNGQREPLEQQHMVHHAHTQKLTQSNFYQQQQASVQQSQQQSSQPSTNGLTQTQQSTNSGVAPSSVTSSQGNQQQQQSQLQQVQGAQSLRGQMLHQAQLQKHKTFSQQTVGTTREIVHINQPNGLQQQQQQQPQQQQLTTGSTQQVGTVRQTNKSYKRRFIVNQNGNSNQGQVQQMPAQLQNNVPTQNNNNNTLQIQQPQQQNNMQSSHSQRAAPSRGGKTGPSTYYDDAQSDTKPSHSSQDNWPQNMKDMKNQGNNQNGPQTGSSYQISTNNFQQRIINPRDINFHNSNQYSLSNQTDYGGAIHKNHGVSPNKKSTFNVGGPGNNNQGNSGNSNQVERINVTIPNPLLMPNASVQIQYQQELIRNVLQRVDDIFHLKQIVDIKNSKLKDKALASNDQDSTNVFDEVKNREIQRINKENSMLQRFKDARIEDKLLRKQFVKGCRKISVAFKGVVEEDEELERDLTNQKELLVSEVSCLEIMGEKLTKKQICAMTCKARLIESCLKEKEYDPYFSISLVLQGARNSFMREVGRHIDCYAENVESQNSSNLVRRIFKNMSDTHHVRRVKLYKDSKIDKYFKLLISFNEESKKHIVQYKLRFTEAQIRQQNYENFINQEMQRRNRETREGSSLNRHDRDNSSGGGSRVRGSVNRDMTPNKLGKQLQMNSSLSSSDTNIVNIKNHATQNGRNIKTPQSSGQQNGNANSANTGSAQNSSSKAQAALNESGQKPTRLSLRMLSEKNKLKLQQQQQQQQQQMNQQWQNQNKNNKNGMQSRKSQQLANQDIVINNTSRKSLKQLQQLKRSQQKLNGEIDQMQGSSLTNGEDSTQISNNNDFYNKARRTTSGGAFTYMGSHGQGHEKGSCVTPPLSIYAMYQADLFEMQNNRPRWFGHYLKFSRNFTYKVRILTVDNILQLTELQSSLNMDFILKYFWQLQDDLRQRKILTFVLIRNLLKIQNFWRAIKRMRNEAALKIQRTRRLLKIQRNNRQEMEQKIDQLQYRCQIKKIQQWTKGQLKLIKSKRSKVNPAVEQVLRDPERVMNSKMIQEILIPIVLRIQRAIRYWIYRRKYLPYLRLKRERDKIFAVHAKTFIDLNKQYQPLLAHDSYKLHKHVGFKLHMRQMPNYFIDLQAQASKQLNGDDIKSIVKSRAICETRLEQAIDAFKQDLLYESRMLSTQNIIQQFYS